jgi:hypothetical protein
MQEVPGQAGGGSFEIETPIAYRAKQRMCLLCFAATIFLLLIPVPSLFKAGPFPISSDLIASQLLLEIAHCIPLCHPISSHLISRRAFSAFFTSHLGAKAEKSTILELFYTRIFKGK